MRVPAGYEAGYRPSSIKEDREMGSGRGQVNCWAGQRGLLQQPSRRFESSSQLRVRERPPRGEAAAGSNESLAQGGAARRGLGRGRLALWAASKCGKINKGERTRGSPSCWVQLEWWGDQKLGASALRSWDLSLSGSHSNPEEGNDSSVIVGRHRRCRI